MRIVLSYVVFAFSIANPHDVPVWNQMASIKSNILKRWDIAPMGVGICAIKFVQKIIQVQTPGMIADPRVREFYIGAIPRKHADNMYSAPSRTKYLLL